MTAQTLVGRVTDPDARARYGDVFGPSDFDAMLACYKQNYPEMPPEDAEWDWIDADYTLVTAPDAGHFVQQDAAELVTSTLRWWLLDRE